MNTKQKNDFMRNIPIRGNPNRISNTSKFDLLQKVQGGIYGASALASVVGAGVNYNMIKTQNASLGVQANQVELQAEQEINSAREQFISSISSLKYNAVQRGIKSSSGSVQQNLEMSSRNFGEDTRITKQNAEMQAESLRGQQKVNNKVAKAQMWGNVGNSFLSLGSALGGMAIEKNKVDKVKGLYSKIFFKPLILYFYNKFI